MNTCLSPVYNGYFPGFKFFKMAKVADFWCFCVRLYSLNKLGTNLPKYIKYGDRRFLPNSNRTVSSLHCMSPSQTNWTLFSCWIMAIPGFCYTEDWITRQILGTLLSKLLCDSKVASSLIYTSSYGGVVCQNSRSTSSCVAMFRLVSLKIYHLPHVWLCVVWSIN